MKKRLLICLALISVTITLHAQSFTRHIIDDNTTAGEIHHEPYEIASGNLDGVGGIDLVMATYDYNGGTPTQDYIKWYSGDGVGGFTYEGIISSTIQYVDGLTIADIDGMHGDDIVATSVNQNKLVYFLSDGAGGFGSEVLVNTIDPINGAGSVVAGDINGDGNTDLVTVAYGDNETKWFSGDGLGGFNEETDIETGTANGDGPYYVDLADFDGDTYLDVVVGFVNSQTIRIYYNQYDGADPLTATFAIDGNTVDTAGSAFLFDLTTGDVNNDGTMNVVKADFSGGLVAWFSKNMDGTYSRNTICNSAIISNPAAALVADIDNDGLNDVIVTDGGTADDAIIWFKGASMAAPSATENLVFNTNNINYDLTVGDFDSDTDVDIAVIGKASDTVDWFESDLNPLSVEASNLDVIKMYPNPVSSILNFKGLSNKAQNITVTDVLGRHILNTTVSSENGLNVAQLNSGVYIIKFDDTNTTYKFIKE